MQGAEIHVLKSTDFTQPIGCIAIELEGHRRDEDDECRRILKSHGFQFKTKLLISEIWVNPLYQRASLLYNIKNKLHFSKYDIPAYAQKHFKSLLPSFE